MATATPRLFVDISVGGVKMASLIDTGCSDSMAHAQFFDVFQDKGYAVVDNPISARTANGGELEMAGFAYVPVTIGSKTVTQRIYLAKKLSHHFILGWNTLRALGAVIDSQTGTLTRTVRLMKPSPQALSALSACRLLPC